MLKRHSLAFGILTLICDLALTAISFSAARPAGNIRLLLIVLPLWALLFKGMRLYESQRFCTLKKEIFNIIKAVSIGVLILSALCFIFDLNHPDRGLILSFFIINAALLALWRASIRLFLRYVRGKGYNYRNFLIVGTGNEAEKVLQLINELKHLGIRVSGLIAPGSRNTGSIGRKIQGYAILGTVEDLPNILYRECADGAIIALPINHFKDLKKSLEACEEMGIAAYIASDFLKRKVAKAYLEELCGIPFLSFATTPQFPGLIAIKRFLDIVISIALLVLLSPLFLVIGLSIKFTSKGPALFRQSRVGLYGKRFILLKFRTMVHDAEQLKAMLDARNAMDGPAFKIKNDPRITAAGRILRKLSIDELPQLINVLRGEMSLVGPRPPLPEEVAKYARWQIRRLSMPPGITCTWQVSGRNHIRFEDWVRLDLQYIDNWSLFLDFKILFKTVFAVAACKGAY